MTAQPHGVQDRIHGQLASQELCIYSSFHLCCSLAAPVEQLSSPALSLPPSLSPSLSLFLCLWSAGAVWCIPTGLRQDTSPPPHLLFVCPPSSSFPSLFLSLSFLHPAAWSGHNPGHHVEQSQTPYNPAAELLIILPFAWQTVLTNASFHVRSQSALLPVDFLSMCCWIRATSSD